jgi:hypothetical protein
MTRNRFLLFLLTLALTVGAAAQDVRARGQLFDKQITSTAQHPWSTTKLCVQYTSPSPSSQVYTGVGFWDSRTVNGDIFRIRAAFNETGLWNWTLINNAAAGCVSTSTFSPPNGTINVSADATGLPLYATGPVRVGATGHYLVYSGAATLTGFQWMGDTSWDGPHLSTLPAWQSYTQNRQSKGDTVIQVSVPLGMGVVADISGNTPFYNPAGGTGCNTGPLPRAACFPRKAFWDAWDQHINDVNVKGMLAVVIGLYKPVNDAGWPTLADSKGYARLVAGRLAGNYTALAPGFDELPARTQTIDEINCDAANPINQACRARQVGIVIKDSILVKAAINAPAPRLGEALTTLVTHHIGGACPDGGDGTAQCLSDLWLSRFQTEDWLDFQLIQSGQGLNCPSGAQEVCIANRSSQRVLRVYNNTVKIKPVVVGEAIYDQFGFQLVKGVTNCAAVPSPVYGTSNANYTAYRGRQTAFNTLLSGGTGFTHGIGGTWDWNGTFTCRTVSEGTNAPSSVQLGRIRQLFSTLRWYRLLPDCELWGQACSHIKNADQATVPDDLKRMYAKDSNGAFAVAYIPDSGTTAYEGSIKLDLADLSAFTITAPWKTEWYNPRRPSANGGPCVCTASVASVAGTVYTFNRPYQADWGLVLRNTSNIPGLGVPACGTPDVNGVVACP